MSEPLTSSDLREIWERCERATPRWVVRELSMHGEALLQMGDEDRHSGLPFRSVQMKLEDAEFAAHARTDLPRLLDEVERLRRENEQIQKWAQKTLDYADERIERLTGALRNLRRNARSADGLAGLDVAAWVDNLLAGREWDGLSTESRDLLMRGIDDVKAGRVVALDPKDLEDEE